MFCNYFVHLENIIFRMMVNFTVFIVFISQDPELGNDFCPSIRLFLLLVKRQGLRELRRVDVVELYFSKS